MKSEKIRNTARQLAKLAALVQLLTYVIAAVTLLSLTISLFTSLSPSDGVQPFTGGILESGDAKFTLNVKNPGFLDSQARFGVRLSAGDWSIEAEKTADIPARMERTMTVEMKLSEKQLASLERYKPVTSVTFESRTLANLSGVGVRAQIGGPA